MNTNNYCIIMAGGFGSRFWPVSQSDNPKQFLDVLGTGRSMLQTTFDRFAQFCPRENIIIVTSEKYHQRVREQIDGLQPYQVLLEPTRRNTAPCIAYAAAIIYERNPNANIIVSPSDHAIFSARGFEQDMQQALQLTAESNHIVTIGVRPTNPNSKYGYIQFSEQPARHDIQRLHQVVTFTEKPPVEIARQFIATGEFFWNAGIFIWNVNTLRQAYQTHLPNVARNFFSLTANATKAEIEAVYSESETISVDFGIMEKADNVFVLEASFGWSDVETWDLLYNTCRHDENQNCIISGNVFGYDLRNSVVHVPGNKTLVLQGLDGYIIAGNDKTLMICRRDQEEKIVKFVSDVELDEMMKQLNKKASL